MYEFFLKYPRLVYEQGHLILAREWPLGAALLAFLAVLALLHVELGRVLHQLLELLL